VSRPEHELDCEQTADAAAYVLGALDDPQAQAYRAHLAGCAICRAEVAQLQPVADALAVGVPPTSPENGLRARIMATVYADAEPLVSAEREADGARWPRRGRRRGLSLAFAVALALGIGLLVGALAINTGSTGPTEAIPAIVVAPGHHASAVLRKVGSHLELVLVGMPPPPPGRIYEVWLEHGAQAPEPTHVLFSVTSAGNGTVGVPSRQGVSRVLVTDEPLGGSLKPTRTPVIVADV
jgi:anti-sigma factor RsiW